MTRIPMIVIFMLILSGCTHLDEPVTTITETGVWETCMTPNEIKAYYYNVTNGTSACETNSFICEQKAGEQR